MPRPKFKNEKPDFGAKVELIRPPAPAMPAKDAAMTDAPPHRFRTGALSHRKPTRFRLTPDTATRVALAESLGLRAIDKLEFHGEITPTSRSDFQLTAQLTAAVTQRCVVTLASVPANLKESVTRRFLADLTDPDGEEVEMPEDDSAEPLPEEIDLHDILREALALALPLYPRAPGAELGEAVYAAPGTEPLRDQDLRPFAGLAALAMKAKDTPE